MLKGVVVQGRVVLLVIRHRGLSLLVILCTRPILPTWLMPNYLLLSIILLSFSPFEAVIMPLLPKMIILALVQSLCHLSFPHDP